MHLVNLGCGPRVLEGWTNVDSALGARLAQLPGFASFNRRHRVFREHWPKGILIHNLQEPLPWQSNSVDFIYCSHVLEHLTRHDGVRLLRECERVLIPGGAVRIVVPDFRLTIEQYTSGKLDARHVLEKLDVLTARDGDGPMKARLAPFFRYPHLCMYDRAALVDALTNAGFEPSPDPNVAPRFQELNLLESPARTDASVVIEAEKPGLPPRM